VGVFVVYLVKKSERNVKRCCHNISVVLIITVVIIIVIYVIIILIKCRCNPGLIILVKESSGEVTINKVINGTDRI